VLGELVHLGLFERPDQEGADEAREDERRVAIALATCELKVGGRKIAITPSTIELT